MVYITGYFNLNKSVIAQDVTQKIIEKRKEPEKLCFYWLCRNDNVSKKLIVRHKWYRLPICHARGRGRALLSQTPLFIKLLFYPKHVLEFIKLILIIERPLAFIFRKTHWRLFYVRDSLSPTRIGVYDFGLSKTDTGLTAYATCVCRFNGPLL